MKKLIFLLIFSIHVFADENWTLLHEDNANQSAYYVKLDNFQMLENKVRLWVMESFNVPQKANSITYNSLKSLVQVDCIAEQLRYMAYSIYKDKKALGQAIYSKGSPSEWIKINPNTVNSAYMSIACQEAKSN
jgi:hypothetical protein